MSFLLLLTAAALVHMPTGCLERSVSPGASGERIEAVIHDAVLDRDWLRLRDCAHPEWPPRLRLANDAERRMASASGIPVYESLGLGLDAGPLVVRAGMQVTVWRDGSARIRLAGTATQSARLGESIVVRCGTGWLLRGIVRGPGSVELATPSSWNQEAQP
ncbi:flagella basal body P-ring formation protein FlgA [Silvibacterium sp.]|uniref:flagella basal body P-ring formation protein FlgA n=1 Tax=Silvibacterium sp. TaxID=1964179 RepID=UPI0039E3C343